MASRSTRYLAASLTLGLAACGVDVAGILGGDAGLTVDSGTHVIVDASRDGTTHGPDAGGDGSHSADAKMGADAKEADAGKDAGAKDSGANEASTKDARSARSSTAGQPTWYPATTASSTASRRFCGRTDAPPCTAVRC